MAELAEGAPLLREYGVYSSIEGSNPSLSAILRKQAHVACFLKITEKKWIGT